MVKLRAVKLFRGLWLALGLGLLLAVTGPAAGLACDTPLYRYAMYRWQAAPYEVYYFHDSPADDNDQRVAALLEEYSHADGALANVVYIPVDTDDDRQFDALPPDVQQAWVDRSQPSPIHFISSPHGQAVAWERLDEVAVRALVESPARKQLAAQLEIGKQGVLVFLAGQDEAANAQAEAVVNEFIGAVQAGEIELYESPTPPGSAAKADPPRASDVGLVKLHREDEHERWFIRTLLAGDKALADEQRPMVFLAYGRARVLPPFMGAGISRENLTREVQFISGRCSCTVKEQNPGRDLLVRYDWESAAAALADKFGAEEGNETRFGIESLFANSLPPALAGDLGPAVPGGVTPADPASGGLSNPADDGAISTSDVTAEEPQPAVPAAANATGGPPPPVSVQPPATVPPPTVEAWSLSVWSVGATLVVAAMILFALTFAVLRPH